MTVEDYQEGYQRGYRIGDNERIFLATENSNLRSDLLRAQQQIQHLIVLGDGLAEALRINQGAGPAAAFMSHRALTNWEEARRD